MTPLSKSIVISVPVGDVDFNVINSIASEYNKKKTDYEAEMLLIDKEEPNIEENDDLLDLDWSDSKQVVSPPVKTENQKPLAEIEDDLLGVDIIEEVKPVKKENAHVDLDLFGDEEVVVNNTETKHADDDLLDFNDAVIETTKEPLSEDRADVVEKKDQFPQINANINSNANPYAFLDNIHTIETLKTLNNNNELVDDDEFVESDVTYREPSKTHAFESSDLMIQYSTREVSS